MATSVPNNEQWGSNVMYVKGQYIIIMTKRWVCLYNMYTFVYEEN